MELENLIWRADLKETMKEDLGYHYGNYTSTIFAKITQKKGSKITFIIK